MGHIEKTVFISYRRTNKKSQYTQRVPPNQYKPSIISDSQ